MIFLALVASSLDQASAFRRNHPFGVTSDLSMSFAFRALQIFLSVLSMEVGGLM